jgi:hypothetical protein
MAYGNWKNCGFAINAIALNTSVLILFYVSVNSPLDAKEDEVGTIQGLFVVIPFIFIVINILIRPIPVVDGHLNDSIYTRA